MSGESIIYPDWPCPEGIHSLVTTRHGGVSGNGYAGFNLASHVGDDPAAVTANRQQLQAIGAVPGQPAWLTQVHGNRVIDASLQTDEMEADGSFATRPGVVCAVMTADCLPVLLAASDGSCVAALHAGWRGLAAGILEQGVRALGNRSIIAYLGPAIGPTAFEVGQEVVERFCHESAEAERAFEPKDRGKWLANIYELARQRLASVGVTGVYGGDRCTFTESDHFFSYRRDRDCGRMASLIWIGSDDG